MTTQNCCRYEQGIHRYRYPQVLNLLHVLREVPDARAAVYSRHPHYEHHGQRAVAGAPPMLYTRYIVGTYLC